jgi:aminoglycoside 2'-N-acetyltransferase I
VAVIEVVRTGECAPGRLAAVRALLDAAFAGDFDDADWEHALGGWHVVATTPGTGGGPMAHAAVVPRTLQIGDRRVRAGYVEAVGTDPAQRGRGLGSAVMRRVGELLAAEFALGALATGRHGFYARLGWERWRGPTFARHGGELVRTPDDDDAVMVLRLPPTADLDPTAAIACEGRRGDDW